MKHSDFNIFKTHLPKTKPEKGKVLIAEPFLQGPYFGRSVIFLTEYSHQGAVGFVINKSSNVYPDEVIDDLLSFKGELFIGGPVSSDTLHFIHTLGRKVPGAVKVTDSIYWGGDFDTIKELINKGEAKESQIKFFAGYSGWSPGQLEDEINEKSWIVSDIDDRAIMSDNIENQWEETINSLGGVFETWSKFPNDPSAN